MKLHLLTAVTRPANLPALAASIDAAQVAGVALVWHIGYDLERTAVGGQAIKNALIDSIADGWVSILDDDNLLHPDLPRRLAETLAAQADALLIVVSQQLPDGGVRRAGLGCLHVDQVDAAQLIVRRDALGERRLVETYAGDGLLAEALAAALPAGQIVYLDEVLSYYNRLPGGVA
jgi:hypothetical protein